MANRAEPPASTPCRNCSYQADCSAYDVLSKLIYTKPGYVKPEMTAKFLAPDKAREVLAMLSGCVEAWLTTVEGAGFEDDLTRLSLPALFDVLMSGLYATVLFDAETRTFTKRAFIHGATDDWAYFPYVWMCPACVADGVSAAEAYLPGATLKADGRMYAVKELLARPEGRMIGDFGALCIRAIVSAITRGDAHFAAGGGHRGEFDLIIATDDVLVLGETKASPLLAFPVAMRIPPGDHAHHDWTEATMTAPAWALFIGAAPDGERYLPLSAPSGNAWPMSDILALMRDPATVETLLRAWKRHFDGYRLFNNEDPTTRWQRFGCGNIELKGAVPGSAKQLRVDNTKILPGIDRTDDIKKGITQVMLFGRLKRGCHLRAVKTVLFGNLYAETHHEHYVRPLASVELLWPGHKPVWLLDGIVALSRNIMNDPQLEDLFGLPNEPYAVDDLTSSELFAATLDTASDA